MEFVTHYFVRLKYKNKEVGADLFPDHQNHLRKLDNDGHLIMAAPFLDGEGGLLFIQADDTEKVWELIKQDPYYKVGRVDYDVHPVGMPRSRDIAILREGTVDYDFIIKQFSR